MPEAVGAERAGAEKTGQSRLAPNDFHQHGSGEVAGQLRKNHHQHIAESFHHDKALFRQQFGQPGENTVVRKNDAEPDQPQHQRASGKRRLPQLNKTVARFRRGGRGDSSRGRRQPRLAFEAAEQGVRFIQTVRRQQISHGFRQAFPHGESIEQRHGTGEKSATPAVVRDEVVGNKGGGEPA